MLSEYAERHMYKPPDFALPPPAEFTPEAVMELQHKLRLEGQYELADMLDA